MFLRHGARLDASDKQWHLTSPTPYDPPLTYGGWTQSRALGARIANILQARTRSHHDRSRPNGATRRSKSSDKGEAQVSKEPRSDDHKHAERERRKYKIVIHTSPFLRCVQTSIAISAGMAQYHGSSPNSGHFPSSKPHHMHSGSPHVRPTESGNSPYLSAIAEPERDPPLHSPKKEQRAPQSTKTLLRLDAFLGEWLSPDYFDLITPPPSSVLMIASAKADLLRRGEYTESLYDSSSSRSGNFPGGWRSGWAVSTAITDSDEDGPLASLPMLGQTLPTRTRASSHSSSGSTGSGKILPQLSTALVAEHGGYVSPTPAYAVSPSEPIPPGYVAHARDACVDVDYQWDSMREPQDWGNGGEYGEEWTAMHKRFRAGLQRMIAWYRNHDVEERRGSASGSMSSPRATAESTNDHVDTVLILVTHGAGCNALIGALTNQPVLLDVGMASLTMAVRKEHPEGESGSEADSKTRQSSISHRRSSIDLGLSDDYDMKLVASTEHLRAGSNPLSPSQTQSPRTSSPQSSTYRHRYGSVPSVSTPVDGRFFLGEPAISRTILRNGFAGVPQRSSSTASPASPLAGLWSAPSSAGASQERGTEDPVDDASGTDDQKENVQTETKDGSTLPSSSQTTTATNSTRGLWGAPVSGTPNEREAAPKRRWTVNEHR